MKKLSVLLITILLGCLVLFGCSSSSSTTDSSSSTAEEDPNKTIIGSWESESVNAGSDDATTGTDVKSVTVIYTYEFKDDGTYTIQSLSTETKNDGSTQDITNDSGGKYTLDGDSLTLEGNDPGKVTVVFENNDKMIFTGEGLGTNDSLTLIRADSEGSNS